MKKLLTAVAAVLAFAAAFAFGYANNGAPSGEGGKSVSAQTLPNRATTGAVVSRFR